MKRIIGIAISLLAVGFLNGCMSCKDGKTHTLFTGLQIERSIEAAESRGMIRADAYGGASKWLSGQEAVAYKAARLAAIDNNEIVPTVAPNIGITAEQLRNETYPWWLRATAFLGDTLTWGALASGAVVGGQKIAEAVDGGESDDHSTKRTSTINVNLNTSNENTVNIQAGEAGDSQSGAAEGG